MKLIRRYGLLWEVPDGPSDSVEISQDWEFLGSNLTSYNDDTPPATVFNEFEQGYVYEDNSPNIKCTVCGTKVEPGYLLCDSPSEICHLRARLLDPDHAENCEFCWRLGEGKGYSHVTDSSKCPFCLVQCLIGDNGFECPKCRRAYNSDLPGLWDEYDSEQRVSEEINELRNRNLK